MKSKLLAAGVMLAVMTSVAFGGVYKWTDAQGRVHYSDAPPQNSGAQQIKLHINSYDGPAIVRPRAAVNNSANTPTQSEVVMYTTSWCGSCKKAKAYLSGKGVPFRELDVELSAEAHQQFQKMGGKGVPLILVGNRRMDGFDPGAMESLLQEAGIVGKSSGTIIR